MTTLFDANCRLGPTPTDRTSAWSTPVLLLAEMDRLGISESLVHSTHALFGHPAEGNRRLLQEIAPYRDRLHPAWVLLPPLQGEARTPAQIVAEMQEAGVKAAFLTPNHHGYLLLPHLLGELPAALEQARLPLFLCVGPRRADENGSQALYPAEWAGIATLCAEHPDLPIVLCGCDGSDRTLWMLWGQTPNLFIETSHLRSPYGLRILADTGDTTAETSALSRLVFGTGLPQQDPGGALGMARWGLEPGAQRAAIAGNTLRRLLGMQQIADIEPATGDMSPAAPATMERREWPPKPTAIFDVQGYLGLSDRAYADVQTAHDLIARMDRAGIERMAVAHFQAFGADFSGGNRRAAEAAAQYPERLLAYAVYNPYWEHRMEKEMTRCLQEEQMAGLILDGPRHEIDTDDMRNQLAFQMADYWRVPILVHPRRSADPVFLNRLLSAYPRLSLILAMPANTSRESLLPLLDVARRHRNLVFDLAAGSGQHGLISWLAGQVGASQIVFGSGFPLHHFAYPLGRVQFSDLSDRDRARILYENAARLFYTHRK